MCSSDPGAFNAPNIKQCGPKGTPVLRAHPPGTTDSGSCLVARRASTPACPRRDKSCDMRESGSLEPRTLLSRRRACYTEKVSYGDMLWAVYINRETAAQDNQAWIFWGIKWLFCGTLNGLIGEAFQMDCPSHRDKLREHDTSRAVIVSECTLCLYAYRL